jgi:Mn-dependent DtxR family transcriptional regulator
MPGRPWRPSAVQLAVLRALARLDDLDHIHARDVAGLTGQSADGAASTLRSLTGRGLATADPVRGYRPTDAGRELEERHHAR